MVNCIHKKFGFEIFLNKLEININKGKSAADFFEGDTKITVLNILDLFMKRCYMIE